MCGIGAIITLPEKEQPAMHIHRMMEVMKHRGPDDEGYLCHDPGTHPVTSGGTDSPSGVWHDIFPQLPENRISDLNDSFSVMLGHRRLSIVDLSVAGHQPLCSEDKRFWIVYNGEVYNFREIREELSSLGISFYSDSDTEVILKSYITWGEECLNRFNGMWSFVIYDLVNHEFFTARDRFGVKPLYYWISDAGFLAISSEIKGFTVLPGWKPLLNPKRAYDFLVNGLLDHTDETLFSDVFQVRGGHYLKFTLPLQFPCVQTCWYHPSITLVDKNEELPAEKFRYLFQESVKLRFRADVPVGSCLSGGLDSSSIVCIVNDLITSSGEATSQKTFSASSENPRWSEKKYADLVVKDSRIESYYVYPDSESLLNSLDQLVWHQDEPFGTTSIFAQWCVFKRAAEEKMKVMLDGQGADEILFGYTDFVYAIGSNLLKNGHFSQLTHEIKCASHKLQLPCITILGAILYYSIPCRFRIAVSGFLLKNKYSPEWLNSGLKKQIDINESISLIPVASDPSQLSLTTLSETSLPMLLHFEDRNSMAHSIESRVPFTDFQVVEMALSLPSWMKWNHGVSKYILRESMRDILPDIIRKRQDKMGFVTPEVVWMTEENPEIFRNLLISAISDSSGIINGRIIDDFDQVLKKKKEFDYRFWRVIVFSRWMRIFGVKSKN